MGVGDFVESFLDFSLSPRASASDESRESEPIRKMAGRYRRHPYYVYHISICPKGRDGQATSDKKTWPRNRAPLYSLQVPNLGEKCVNTVYADTRNFKGKEEL